MQKSIIKTLAAKATGLGKDTVLLYTQKGIVVPEVDNPTGRGVRKKYSEGNLVQMLIANELSRCGMTLERIRALFAEARCSDVWRKLHPDFFMSREGFGALFVVYGHTSDAPRMEVVKSCAEIEIQGGKSALVFSSAGLFDSLNREVYL
jgi:DNA-binding transcriptional MerR regulator